MFMKRYIFNSLFIFLLLASIGVWAQPGISFEQPEHDFGQIQEDDGAVVHKFWFTNTGNQPLVIKHVQSSCGCTTPDWTKDPVPAGQQGYIIAKYSPKNRPGAFKKTLTVMHNAPEGESKLLISGTVIKTTDMPAKEYPNKMGSLRSRYSSFQMGKLNTKDAVAKRFPIFNTSTSQAIKIDSILKKPDYIDITFVPESIPPQGNGALQITYNPKLRGELGFVSDVVEVLTNDSSQLKKDIRVIATITEYFPEMSTEELEGSPIFSVNQTVYDMGNLNQNEVVHAKFVVTNTGKKTLNIRDVKTNCSCTEASIDQTDIEPGKSAELKVSFDPSGRRGSQYKSITVFTNDPRNPTNRLVVKGNIRSSDE